MLRPKSCLEVRESVTNQKYWLPSTKGFPHQGGGHWHLLRGHTTHDKICVLQENRRTHYVIKWGYSHGQRHFGKRSSTDDLLHIFKPLGHIPSLFGTFNDTYT